MSDIVLGSPRTPMDFETYTPPTHGWMDLDLDFKAVNVMEIYEDENDIVDVKLLCA